MKIGYKTLIEEAEKNIETISVDEVAALLNDDTVTIVDIRDVRELQREGKLPGAIPVSYTHLTLPTTPYV